MCVYHSATTPFAGLSRPSSCCEPHGGQRGIITLIAYAHWRRANLCQAPKPQNTLLSKTSIMNTTSFGRSHFNPAPSIFSAFRSASTSSRLNSIAEFFSRSGLYSPDILPLDMIVEPTVIIAPIQFQTCHHVRLRSITTAHGQSHEIGRFDQRILYISDVHRSINLQSKILLHSFYPAAPAGR